LNGIKRLLNGIDKCTRNIVLTFIDNNLHSNAVLGPSIIYLPSDIVAKAYFCIPAS